MNVPKPPISFIGTAGNNIWKGTGLAKSAIVLHIAQGEQPGIDSWFANPAAKASANFSISETGQIHCYVDPAGTDAPFANGIVNKPDPQFSAWLAQFPPNTNPNDRTISIEHAGFSGSPTQFPAAQLHASAWLTAWLCEQHGIAFSEDTLFGHFEIDSVSRAQCPGLDRAGFLAYEAAVGGFLQAPAPSPSPSDPRIAAALAVLPAAELAVKQASDALAKVRAALSGTAAAARPDAFEQGAPGEA